MSTGRIRCSQQCQAAGPASSHDQGGGMMRDAPVKDMAQPQVCTHSSVAVVCANKARGALCQSFSPSPTSLLSMAPALLLPPHSTKALMPEGGVYVSIPPVSSEVRVSTHSYCPLTKHTVMVGILLCGISGYSKFTQKAAAWRGEQEDASPAPTLTHGAGLEKMLVEFGKEAEICISPIISKLQ